MDSTDKLSILVMSCDKYSGIWADFFKCKDLFWPDCPYKTYLATDSKPFNYNGVETIHFGNVREWSQCVRLALDKIDTPYVCLWLEDALICEKIDTSIIQEDLDYVINNNVDYFCIEIKRRFIPEQMKEVANHLRVIDPHQRYGVDTAVAIWERNYFLEKLQKDCNPWQFEVDRCAEAATEAGINGITLYDDRHPANVSPVEILRRGKFRPEGIRFMKSKGFELDTSVLPIMSRGEVFKEWLRGKASRIKFGKGFLKAIGKRLGFYVYTSNE